MQIKLLDWNVEWTTSNSAIFTHGPAFSFVSRDRKQCHPILTCRDYLGDMVFSQVNGWKLVETNGTFTYKAGIQPPICLSKIRILFCNPQEKDFKSIVLNSLDLIHQAEDDLGIKRSIIRQVANPPMKYKKTGMYMFMGSGAWMSSPVMLSLYTLLLRLGINHSKGEKWVETVVKVSKSEIVDPYYDKYNCQGSIKGINVLLKQGWMNVLGNNIKKNFPGGIREGTTHSNFGIRAFGDQFPNCKRFCPHWFPEKT